MVVWRGVESNDRHGNNHSMKVNAHKPSGTDCRRAILSDVNNNSVFVMIQCQVVVTGTGGDSRALCE